MDAAGIAPEFLPTGGVGSSGPMPGDASLGGAMGWDREAYAIDAVQIAPATLEAAFSAATGAQLEAKLGPYDGAQRDKLVEEFGELGLLNMEAKKIDAFINPPPPKPKEDKPAPAKKE